MEFEVLNLYLNQCSSSGYIPFDKHGNKRNVVGA